jgi:hypothetical protein
MKRKRKLEKIRQKRRESGSKVDPEQKIQQELGASAESVIMPQEKFKWVQEIIDRLSPGFMGQKGDKHA